MNTLCYRVGGVRAGDRHKGKNRDVWFNTLGNYMRMHWLK